MKHTHTDCSKDRWNFSKKKKKSQTKKKKKAI